MKLGHVPSIVRLTISTSNTPISAAKQHTASTDTELGKKRANDGSVVARDGLLVVPIRGRDCLRNRLLEGDVFEPIDVRFVRVICLIASEAMEDWQGCRRSTWSEVIGNERRRSPGTGRTDGCSPSVRRERSLFDKVSSPWSPSFLFPQLPRLPLLPDVPSILAGGGYITS